MLQRWTKPNDYAGFSPDGDYLLLSRHRDSLLLDRVNWSVACERLNARPYDGGAANFANRPAVYHWRAGHCLVGWAEYLMVRADAPAAAIAAAHEIMDKLDAYPILSDDRYSAAELDAVCEYWEGCSIRERLEYLQRAELNIFAARRAELPEDPNGYLFELLSEGL